MFLRSAKERSARFENCLEQNSQLSETSRLNWNANSRRRKGGRAVRLTAYEGEMAALHDAAQRLQSRMEASYMQQRRFKNGILDESEEKHPKAANARQRPAAS